MRDPRSTRVLFLSNDASLGGAPVLLLHFVRWLCSHTSVQPAVVVKWDGPLVTEFSSLASTMTLNPQTSAARWLSRGWSREHRDSLHRNIRRARLLRFARRHRPDLIYANTVVVAEEVRILAEAGYPVLWHVHEMRFNIGYCGGEAFRDAIDCAVHFIAASEPVRDALLDFGVSPAVVDVLHEFINPQPVDSYREQALRHRIRRELAIPADAFVVGMCGLMDWRKGADLFPPFLRYLLRDGAGKDIHAVWIGGEEDSGGSMAKMRHDAIQLGIESRLHLTGLKTNATDYMPALDVFALTSREDPMPLAMLEAAACGVPIVCFAGGGGAEEFVRDGAGCAVSYLDVPAMAQATLQLACDHSSRKRIGEFARQKVFANYTTARQAPKLLDLLSTVADRVDCPSSIAN